MRLAFVTGCLEPGRNGVGDYARLLAAACARRGHAVRLLSVADYVSGVEDGDVGIRREESASWRADGGAGARRWLDEFRPDWTSLQFVPFSFDPRGFFGASIAPLSHLLAAAPRRHVFVHEIWIGSHAGAPWRTRLAGGWQRRALRRLLRTIGPAAVHTNTALHVDALATLGQPAKVLPLFGNVPVVAAAGPGALADLPERALVCGMFGTLHAEWESDRFLADFATLAKTLGRPAALVAAGGLGAEGTIRFAALAEKWRGSIHGRATGRLPAEEMAGALGRFDFAVTSVPWNIVGKSGSAAALRERGLRVVVTAAGSPPRFPARTMDDLGAAGGFVPYFLEPSLTPAVLEKTAPGPDAAAVADRFLADLHDPA